MLFVRIIFPFIGLSHTICQQRHTSCHAAFGLYITVNVFYVLYSLLSQKLYEKWRRVICQKQANLWALEKIGLILASKMDLSHVSICHESWRVSINISELSLSNIIKM